MFFPNLITGIDKSQKVLEVGPGGYPHYRSDVLLEKKFQTKHEAEAQRGFTKLNTFGKTLVYYNGSKFPFEDKEFDYVICSHVIEHIPLSEISEFISELERVAPRGYIEFPNIFYELINMQEVHKSFILLSDNEIKFMTKNKLVKTNLQKVIQHLFYGKDGDISKIFNRHKSLFFQGIQWNGHIRYKMVECFDDLVSESDVNKLCDYIDRDLRLVDRWILLQKITDNIRSIPLRILKKIHKY